VGFCTVLNDIVSPHLQSIFNLSYKQASLVQFAFFFAYFIFSIPARSLLTPPVINVNRLRLLTMAAGAFLFIPRPPPPLSIIPRAIGGAGAGITVLQVAANPYVAVLGPAKTASVA